MESSRQAWIHSFERAGVQRTNPAGRCFVCPFHHATKNRDQSVRPQYIHKQPRTQSPACTRPHISTLACALIRGHTHTTAMSDRLTRRRVQALMKNRPAHLPHQHTHHTYRHTHTHTHTYTHIHTVIYTHRHIHTYSHTHTHIIHHSSLITHHTHGMAYRHRSRCRDPVRRGGPESGRWRGRGRWRSRGVRQRRWSDRRPTGLRRPHV
jgi:hypothetical protein